MTEFLEQQQEESRPTLLTVLSVLSLISIGVSLIVSLFSLAGGPLNEEELIESRVELARSKTQLRQAGMHGMISFFDQLQGMVEETNENFYLSKGIMLVTDLTGLFGVILMLRRRKFGFHLYIIYSLLALGGVYLYVSPQNINILLPIVNVLIAGLFIFLYSRTLKWLR